MQFEEFQEKVTSWATQRGIYAHSTAQAQFSKTISEMGEMADNLIKGRDITDDWGDTLVCLINVAVLANISTEAAFEHAWNEIKDRKGHMTAEGAFVKEGDT